MANTMVLIGSTTVATATSSIAFSSIPQTYTDLMMVLCSRSTSANNWTSSYITGVNGSGRAIAVRNMVTDGSSVSSGTSLLYTTQGNNWPAGYFGSLKMYFPNYTNTSFNKNVSVDMTADGNGTGGQMFLGAGTIALTAAISSFSVGNDANWAVNTTAYLYGIKNS
jgi:hypothetical protein